MIWRLIAWIVSRPWIAWELIFLAIRTPYTDIRSPDGSEIYMKRWWLFNPYDADSYQTRYRWCPVSIRVHWIRRPDFDRHLHDHPWNFRTIILAGGYLEDREDGVRYRRKPGDTVALKFGQFHRIGWVRPEGAWTLFITTKYRGTWGFLVNGVKIPWREYLGLDQKDDHET